MKQREIIDKTLEEENETEAKARVSWNGKQYIVRFPSIISNMINLDTKHSVEFKVDYETKNLKMKLVKEATK